MGAKRSGTDLSEHVFPTVALTIGVVAAPLVAAMPQASLDVLMWRLWLPHVIPAATPPIGATGRTVFALLTLLPFVAAALAARRVRGRARRIAAAAPAQTRLPSIRRADAHPDAPPRRPIRAEEDLGEPLPIITVAPARGVPEPEQPLPVDLDQPLAAFDPIAIPDVPRAPVRAVPPLATIVVPARDADAIEEPEEAAEEMTALPASALLAEEAAEAGPVADQSPITAEPAVTVAPEPAVQDQEEVVDGTATLAGLLDRLERGAHRRQAPQPAPPSPPLTSAEPVASLDDTLVMLRRMARS